MGNLGSTINFAAGDYQVMVGNLDVTPLVAQFSLGRPLPDVGTPYAWTGSVTLVEGLNANTIAESLNDLINPVRWAKGIHPVTVSIDGFKVATLRVLEYFYEDDPGPEETPTAEMQLGDLLVLNDYKTPPKDYKGLGFGLGSVSINAIAAKVFSELNLTGEVDVLGAIDVAPDKPDGSWIQWLQSYLGERGYWLYVDPNEIIRVAAYPLNYDSSGYLANFARRQVENYKRNRSAVEIPVEKQLVTATCEKRLPQGSSGQLQTLIEYAQIGNRLSISRSQSNRVLASTPTRKVEEIIIEQAKGLTFPELFPNDTGLIQTAYTRETTTANIQGKVYKKETATSMPLGLALPDLYGSKREGLAMVENAEIIIEEWRSSSPRVSSSDTSIVRYHLVTTYKTLPVGSNAYKVDVAAQVSEEWSEEVAILGGDESTPKCERFRYERIEQKRSVSETSEASPGGTNQPFFVLGALAVTNQERKNDQSPPAWDTLAPAQDSSSVTLKGVAKFAPVGYTPYAETEDEYQANTLQTVGECNRLAQLLGTLKHHAYKSRDINAPPPNAWKSNPAPFHTAAIHDGVYVLCADSLALSEEELEIAWTGHYVGAIPTIFEPDTVPTFAPVPVFTEPVEIVASLEPLTGVVTAYDRFENYADAVVVATLEGLTAVVTTVEAPIASIVATLDGLTAIITATNPASFVVTNAGDAVVTNEGDRVVSS